ncbi:glycosyltransferase family 39 protein [Amycolatopsis sp. FDAARGOS 1241]|uniref:glycosyltransferase family 39 protein n=1 Tax=Amycolatopsis sp. FDAARGOS 1241 TaxID=2778070 RepID=UPI0019517371|nr:glycosyltransferase family 39 protein [Amycolatopsis sp. FDAARGOS 1241]QRP45927.1 glycosyltransferase family 39 protein [Amycolatopsis sp. FDAARGOS 1241]
MQSTTLAAGLEPRSAFATRVRPALPAVGLYVLFQLLAFGVLWLMSWKADVSPGRFVGAFDANWFTAVADHWYTQPVTIGADGVPQENSLAFFPLYPAFIALLGLLGLPALPAALTVTLLAGCAAAWGLFELGRDFAGPRVGTLLAVLWSITPGAVVLHLGYSESLLVALVAWTLVALGRRQWLLAGGLSVLAGLTRAGAGALVVAVCVAALVAVVRRRDGWRPWVGGLVAPLGLLGYLEYIAVRTGRVDGWFWLQQAWHMSFDFGRFTWIQVREGLTANTSSWITVTALLVIVAVALQLWTWITRMPLAWQVYGTVTVLIALCSSNFFQTRMRYLLPAFVLTVPIALVCAKLPNRVLAILLPVIAVVSAWYGAFLLTIVHLNP